MPNFVETFISELKKLISAKLAAVIVGVLAFLFTALVTPQCDNIHSIWHTFTHHPLPWNCTATSNGTSNLSQSSVIQSENVLQISAQMPNLLVPPLPSPSESRRVNGLLNEEKLNFVRQMTAEAWHNYAIHAWGYDAVGPENETQVGNANSDETIVAAMSTLLVMGLKQEFDQGREWIEKHFDLNNFDGQLYIGHVVANYIGGLLSCYAQTGDSIFLTKASQIAQTIEPAYRTDSGLSYQFYTPKSKTVNTSGTLLSTITSQQLEYSYLANLTNDPNLDLMKRLESIQTFIRQVDKPNGLLMLSLDVENKQWRQLYSTLSWTGSEVLGSFVKLYIQSGGQKLEQLDMFTNLVEQIERNGMIGLFNGEHLFVREYNLEFQQHLDSMDTTACNLGAIFALAAETVNQTLSRHHATSDDTKAKLKLMRKIDLYWKLAEKLTDTCHLASIKTDTGLPPWRFYFDKLNYATNLNGEEGTKGYKLSSELAESYFILWRLTHDQKYREYAWELVQAIHKHCRTEEGGYLTIADVNQIPTEKTRAQVTIFFSATLKYLYLTFTEDSVLPLDQWVFNSYGHPLPICGTNAVYPPEKCLHN